MDIPLCYQEEYRGTQESTHTRVPTFELTCKRELTSGGSSALCVSEDARKDE